MVRYSANTPARFPCLEIMAFIINRRKQKLRRPALAIHYTVTPVAMIHVYLLCAGKKDSVAGGNDLGIHRIRLRASQGRIRPVHRLHRHYRNLPLIYALTPGQVFSCLLHCSLHTASSTGGWCALRWTRKASTAEHRPTNTPYRQQETALHR